MYVPGDPNEPPLARSNFDPGHRITVSGGYDIPMPSGLTARVAVFYSGQSGRPWSANFAFDANGDVRGTNDLLYFPTATDNIVYTNGTYEDLLTYVNNDSACRTSSDGSTSATRAASPWINTFDMKFALGLPVRARRWS